MKLFAAFPIVMAIGLLFSLTAASAERDYKADLIIIGARFALIHSRTSHRSGDKDEQFIEDVITPAVADIVESGGRDTTKAQREAILKFILATESSASEQISEIGVSLYKFQKKQTCASLAAFSNNEQVVILSRIKSGFEISGKPVPNKICG